MTLAPPAPAPEAPRAPLQASELRTSSSRQRKERRVRRLLFGFALLSIVVSVAIIVVLAWEAVAFLRSIELGWLWTDGWFPRRDMFDLRTVLVGSLLVTGIALLFAVPLGLGAAIYLSEYARPRVRRVLKPIIEILAGIPSVVLGFFALTFITPNVVQVFFNSAGQFNLLAAGLGVGVLTIPLVASVSEDAMRAVPSALREASYGMGARKMTTVVRVVLPAAISGLVAAFILAASRAIGETTVVAIAGGATGGSLFSANPLQAGQTMTAAMASLATGTDQLKGGSAAYYSLFFLGLLLFFITLLLNMVGDRLVRRVRHKY